MLKKLIVGLLVLLIPVILYAADLLDQTEDTDPTSDDMMYCVNDPAGTPADRKCTVGNVAKGMTSTNLTDTADILYETELDTFSELDAQIADQTLVHSGSNIATATALEANGLNCSAGSYPLGVDDAGAVESCTDATTEIDSAISTHNASDTHVDHTSVTLTAGAGLSGGGDISDNRSFATDSSEAAFLAAGALTCGAGTAGKIQIHTTPLQYCDNAATPTLRYGAYGSSAGIATEAANLSADGVDALTEIAQGIKTAANDTSALVVGTAGSTGEIAEWDANGNLVDSNVTFGTMTDGKLCGYTTTGTVIDCDNDPSALGADAVGTAELDDDANTPTAGYAVVVEAGAASFDYVDLSAVYQPLEATLTDIADGTITENLVNTANPWADNEVADDITASSYLPLAGGVLTGEVTVDNLGLEFTAGDDHTDCTAFSATGGGIFFDDSEGIFKKCQDNTLSDLDTGGAETNSLEADGAVGIADTEIFIGTGAGTGNYAAMSGEATMANTGAVTLADSVAVTSWNLTTPTITTSLTTSTPTTISAAELDRLDGLTSAIIDDDKIDTYSELNTIVADQTLTHNGLIDTFAELDTIVADKALVKLEDAQTFTGTKTFPGLILTAEAFVDALGLEFEPGDALTDCSTFAATGGGIFYDDSEGKLKKCEENTLSDLDTTGSGSLGSNLSSTTTDILSDTGTIVLGGTGNTNNEKISLDFETTANTVALATSTLVDTITLNDFGLEVDSIITDPVAAPSADFYDVDGTDADINGQISGNLTDTGSGTEDFDMFIKQQIAGTLTTVATFDADGVITFAKALDLGANNLTTTGNIELGHATANTLSASGGVLSIEGVALATVKGATNLTLPVQSAKLTGTFAVAGDASQGAQIDAGEGVWRLLFDATTDEGAVWQFIMPDNYASAPTLTVHFSMASAESLEVQFEGSIMCYTSGTDTADVATASFAAVDEGSATTVSATAGEVYQQSITLTDDSCAAGDMVWIQLSTDADDATNDDATGDREVIGVEFGYTGS